MSCCFMSVCLALALSAKRGHYGVPGVSTQNSGEICVDSAHRVN
jgi:hypothetical protein